MAPRRVHLLLLLPLLCLAAGITAARGSVDFRADLRHPHAASSFSKHESFRRSARASNARVARLGTSLARIRGRGGGAKRDFSAADQPVAPLSDQCHTVTLGIGTPPQPQNLILDTASSPIWTQCGLFRHTAAQREPIYDPTKSSSFSFLPCSSKLCREAAGFKNCSKHKCMFEYPYVSVLADGVGAIASFSFGARSRVSVPLVFGCAELTDGSLFGASGIIGLGLGRSSLVSQLKVSKFSYCFTPFAERKSSLLLFGDRADLHKYKTTGPIQTTSLLRRSMEMELYYVPLVGLSLGGKRLELPADSLAVREDGGGGAIVDSGSTIMYLVEPAFEVLKKEIMETVRLPLSNRSVEDYRTCFTLPNGVEMDMVPVPVLLLHFQGGAAMVLRRESYFQEPRPGLMCLAVVPSSMTVIWNVQQQNMHILFDIGRLKFSFAPTQCSDI